MMVTTMAMMNRSCHSILYKRWAAQQRTSLFLSHPRAPSPAHNDSSSHGVVRFKSTTTPPSAKNIYWDNFKDNAQAIGVLLAGMGSVFYLGGSYVVMAKNVQLSEERQKTELEKAKKEIEKAKRETAERFLMYGYAEEFKRYQKKTGIYKDTDGDKEVDE